MKQCLITGGGSKFGRQLTEQLVAYGYHVHLITSSNTYINDKNITVIPVDWKSVDLQDLKTLIPAVPALDLIFFNHNASSLSHNQFCPGKLQNFKDWQHSYFVACQLPFYLVHVLANKITPDTKISWMLSELIFDPKDSQIGFADYIGNKFTNACIMKSFSINHPACFFGLHPAAGTSLDDELQNNDTAKDMVKFIDSSSVDELNGRIFSANGQNFVFGN